MSLEWLFTSLPPAPVIFGQLLVGVINGSFYALLSLGLAVIFGLLNIINFAHGVQYMLGAFIAYLLLIYGGINYWVAIPAAAVAVGLLSAFVELTLLRRTYKLDFLYGMLLTFGVALVVEGLLRNFFGATGRAYPVPAELAGGVNLGFMFLPTYRAWVVAVSMVICLGTWLTIEKTKIGSYLRAATENAPLTRSFGIKVPVLITAVYSAGAALAALTGVMAAPIYQVNTLMGSEIIIVVFAVVVIGGMGSIVGAIVSGYALGIAEGLTKVIYPESSTLTVFIVMTVVLIFRPTGLFGKPVFITAPSENASGSGAVFSRKVVRRITAVALLIAVASPLFLYPTFLMQILCFALFACAFNLIAGYGRMVAFGHAAFFGGGSYVAAYLLKHSSTDPLIAILAGGLCAGGLGLLFGSLAIRRQGIYFSMVTLALAQMVFFFASQSALVGRDEGISGVPRGHLFGFIDLEKPLNMYYFLLLLFVAGYGLISRIIHSPFGQVFRGINESEARMISLGYEPWPYKLLAFTLSAALAGVAGAAYALTFQMASISSVHWSMSGQVLLMTLVGGIGTLAGPIVGAILIAAMDNYLGQFGSWVVVTQGVIFIVCILFFRRGLAGEFLARSAAWIARSKAIPVATERDMKRASL